jgi:2-C-methyl-D-erythritol 2,4-cyclodiphosphate synthase
MGGVVVAQGISAVAHSDGDVVIHAIVDALLGALGMGDIGEHFPDTDPAYRGANSAVFLEKMRQHLAAGNWRVVNCDVTVMAERPKIRYIKPKMKTFLEGALGGGGEAGAQVNIKAGTNEECGEIGRGEAVAAHAVVLLSREA